VGAAAHTGYLQAGQDHLMADLTRRDRLMAAGEFDQLAERLDVLSSWLSSCDEDRAAIVLECASRDLRAVCWLLRPVDGSLPEGWLTSSNGRR
jgi:hypothetical protein